MQNVYDVLFGVLRVFLALVLTLGIAAAVLLVVAFFSGYGPESCHENWEAANRKSDADEARVGDATPYN